MEGYEKLASAIVLQAVKDYRTSSRRLRKDPENLKAYALKRQCERFFRSDWFKRLTKVNGPQLLRRLKKEAE